MDERPAPEEASPFDVFDDDSQFNDPDDATSSGESAEIAGPTSVRQESLRQREHFASTGNFVLQGGPKVRVLGRTLLIHDKEGKPRGVKLQLVRQEHQKAYLPDWAIKPATIYLSREATEELYARLHEARLTVAETAETAYFVVRTGADPDITGLETLLRSVAENPAQFVPLLTMVGAERLDALRAVVNFGRFRLARQELERLIAEDPGETAFQHWFEANDWVFGTEYVRRLTKPRHISPDSIIDLMFEAVDGFVDIFELKRPSPDVFVHPAGRTYLVPSADLNAAFGQAVHYLADADNMGFFNQVAQDVPFYRPRIRLVIGRSNEWTDEHFRVYRETTTAWNRIELLTYDMVLRRIDLLIETMRAAVTSAGEAPEDVSGTSNDLPF